jgi:hypothetical protein
MGKLLSEYILGKNVNLDSFNISRLIQKQ